MCELVRERGNVTEMLELAEQAVDEVALAVKRGGDRTLEPAVAPGRDVGSRAPFGDQPEDGLGVTAAVGDDVAGRTKSGEQRWHKGLVGDLA